MIEKRQLGRTGLHVSALALGTVSLGMNYGIAAGSNAGLPPPATGESVALVQRALDAGINFFDTARAYGHSEAVLGQALAGRRAEAVIATKINCLDADGQPLTGAALRARLHESIGTSLTQLQIDQVDLCLLHSAPVTLLESGEVVAALRELVTAGRTRFIGASTYGVEAAVLAIEQSVDMLQVAYNVLDRQMEERVFPLAAEHGVGIVVRSVFLKGVLTDRAADLPPHLADLKALARTYRAAVAPHDPAQAALRFALSQRTIDTVLIGVRSAAELDEALAAAAAGPLPDDLLQRLDPLRAADADMLNPSTWGIP